jgi:hypothetical protein
MIDRFEDDDSNFENSDHHQSSEMFDDHSIEKFADQSIESFNYETDGQGFHAIPNIGSVMDCDSHERSHARKSATSGFSRRGFLTGAARCAAALGAASYAMTPEVAEAARKPKVMIKSLDKYTARNRGVPRDAYINFLKRELKKQAALSTTAVLTALYGVPGPFRPSAFTTALQAFGAAGAVEYAVLSLDSKYGIYWDKTLYSIAMRTAAATVGSILAQYFVHRYHMQLLAKKIVEPRHRVLMSETLAFAATYPICEAVAAFMTSRLGTGVLSPEKDEPTRVERPAPAPSPYKSCLGNLHKLRLNETANGISMLLRIYRLTKTMAGTRVLDDHRRNNGAIIKLPDGGVVSYNQFGKVTNAGLEGAVGNFIGNPFGFATIDQIVSYPSVGRDAGGNRFPSFKSRFVSTSLYPEEGVMPSEGIEYENMPSIDGLRKLFRQNYPKGSKQGVAVKRELPQLYISIPGLPSA